MSPVNRRDPIERHMDRCVHFNGIQHDMCNAGVNYRRAFADANGVLKPLPCFASEGAHRPCEPRRFVTREEAEKEEAEWQAVWKGVSLASTAAHLDAKEKGFRKGRSGVGSIPCPVCQKGHLHYSVAAYNGHMHARCDTEGCVSWME